MASDDLLSHQNPFTKENFATTKYMVKESTLTKRALYTKENFTIIKNKALGLKKSQWNNGNM